MFDTEAFIQEVEKRPALYTTKCRESGDMKIALWEEIGGVIYKDWHHLYDPEDRRMKIRELRKKWKSVRDNFLRDFKNPHQKKKRYVYHQQMTFLIPYIDLKRYSGDEDFSDGDNRLSKKKRLSYSENKDFLLSFSPLLDEMPEDDMMRARQELVWTMQAIKQSSRERKVIALMANAPAAWDNFEADEHWIPLSKEANIPIQELKCTWDDLVTDFKNHLNQDNPRDKWKYENEMAFYLSYIKEGKKSISLPVKDIKLDIGDDGKLPVELCQIECSTPTPSHPPVVSPLREFFINMGNTVATFPPRLRAQVKSEVFNAVNNAELILHSNENCSNTPTSSFN